VKPLSIAGDPATMQVEEKELGRRRLRQSVSKEQAAMIRSLPLIPASCSSPA